MAKLTITFTDKEITAGAARSALQGVTLGFNDYSRLKSSVVNRIELASCMLAGTMLIQLY